MNHERYERHEKRSGRWLLGSLVFISCLSYLSWFNPGDPVRVVVWDERQKEQLHAYEGKFLGDTIAEHLRGVSGVTVKSVGQDEYHDEESIAKLIEDCDPARRDLAGNREADRPPDQAREAEPDRAALGALGHALHSGHGRAGPPRCPEAVRARAGEG
jgi:hypothetical protein